MFVTTYIKLVIGYAVNNPPKNLVGRNLTPAVQKARGKMIFRLSIPLHGVH